ncbi:transglycosylase SLT domain-containing protein [Vibrio sp. WXL103]|uniref:transglycosylase SLT domain-containing protein n=1 Tax=Vibrio sp. WXL103 TaxID=3450710 RepID=UPI003EC7B451
MQLFRYLMVLCTCLSLNAWGLALAPLQKDPYLGDMDTFIEKGVVRVLVSADLGFYYVESGRPKGIVAELLYNYEQQLKKRSAYLKIQVIPVARDDLIPSLTKGYGDLAVANLTITPKRSLQVDFSDPLTNTVRELFITDKAHSPITSIEQLSGEEVWVRSSSSYFESLQKINAQLHQRDLPPMLIEFVEETLQDYELLEMINQGHISKTVLDGHKAKLWLDVVDNIQIHDTLPLRENGQIAWAMRKQSPQLKSSVNKFIKTAKAGTLLGNVLYGKYIQNTSWLKQILNPTKIERLESLSGIFETYSERYGFDSLMISAQSFQESGLDQSKVSRAGAVGIMQILPSTAKDPNVNIPNIYEVENNIHAGVKYMRFIKDRYFDDDSITADNQVYFALAAYNAGPGNIRRMRRLAEKNGYDPNQWFHNVEIVTRRNISREPVEYVANINRYYVIYKQLEEIYEHEESNNAATLTTKPRLSERNQRED